MRGRCRCAVEVSVIGTDKVMEGDRKTKKSEMLMPVTPIVAKNTIFKMIFIYLFLSRICHDDIYVYGKKKLTMKIRKCWWTIIQDNERPLSIINESPVPKYPVKNLRQKYIPPKELENHLNQEAFCGKIINWFNEPFLKKEVSYYEKFQACLEEQWIFEGVLVKRL